MCVFFFFFYIDVGCQTFLSRLMGDRFECRAAAAAAVFGRTGGSVLRVRKPTECNWVS